MIPHLPLQKISIKSKYDRITHDLYSNVNKYKIGHECEHWLAKRWNFSTSDMEKAEWSDIKYVLKKGRFHKKHNMSKSFTKCGLLTSDNFSGSKQNHQNALYARMTKKHEYTFFLPQHCCQIQQKNSDFQTFKRTKTYSNSSFNNKPYSQSPPSVSQQLPSLHSEYSDNYR